MLGLSGVIRTLPAGAAGHSVLIAIVNVYLTSGFAFSALNANSISRRMASDREGLSFCFLAHFSISDLTASGNRSASTGSRPVAGRPRFLGITFSLDALRIFW